MAGMAGTAGVWRLAALNEAGGWKDRTTVEDMDLAVRASLKGWKFVYLGDVEVMIPSTSLQIILAFCTLFPHWFYRLHTNVHETNRGVDQHQLT